MARWSAHPSHAEARAMLAHTRTCCCLLSPHAQKRASQCQGKSASLPGALTAHLTGGCLYPPPRPPPPRSDAPSSSLPKKVSMAVGLSTKPGAGGLTSSHTRIVPSAEPVSRLFCAGSSQGQAGGGARACEDEKLLQNSCISLPRVRGCMLREPWLARRALHWAAQPSSRKHMHHAAWRAPCAAAAPCGAHPVGQDGGDDAGVGLVDGLGARPRRAVPHLRRAMPRHAQKGWAGWVNSGQDGVAASAAAAAAADEVLWCPWCSKGGRVRRRGRGRGKCSQRGGHKTCRGGGAPLRGEGHQGSPVCTHPSMQHACAYAIGTRMEESRDRLPSFPAPGTSCVPHPWHRVQALAPISTPQAPFAPRTLMVPAASPEMRKAPTCRQEQQQQQRSPAAAAAVPRGHIHIHIHTGRWLVGLAAACSSRPTPAA